MPKKGVTVIGDKELARDFRKGVAHLAVETAAANRAIGQKVVSKLGGQSSGAGQGATPTPVPMRSMVAIEAGYPGREAPVAPWGRDQTPSQGPRPYILGAALSSSAEIERAYMDGVERVIRRISDQ